MKPKLVSLNSIYETLKPLLHYSTLIGPYSTIIITISTFNATRSLVHPIFGLFVWINKQPGSGQDPTTIQLLSSPEPTQTCLIQAILDLELI